MTQQTNVKLLRDGVRTLLATPATRDTMQAQHAAALGALADTAKLTDEQVSHSYFKLPTGFDRAAMFTNMARAYFNAANTAGVARQKIIVIVPRTSLIEQMQEKLQDFADITTTQFNGRPKSVTGDVILVTYDSLTELLGMADLDNIGLMLADEVHHMLSDKIAKRLKNYNKFVPIIGCTAMPEHDARPVITKMLNTPIYETSVSDAVHTGILSPAKNVLYRSDSVCDLAHIRLRHTGEYDWTKAKVDPVTVATEIARLYATGVDKDTGTEYRNLRAIVNCPNGEIADTEIAELQAQKINEIMGRDVAVALYDGVGDKKFSSLRKDFLAGKYSVVCQTNALTAGFDDPSIALCINYPTRLHVLAEQAAGRATCIDKNNPDKIAFVVDTVFRVAANKPTADTSNGAQKQVLFKDITGDDATEFVGIALVGNTVAPSAESGNAARHIAKQSVADKTAKSRKAAHHIAKRSVADKTVEWLCTRDLAGDPTFSAIRRCIIHAALKKLYAAHERPNWIQVRQPARGRAALCLHRDGRQWFLGKVGEQYPPIPPKTAEWQSATDLVCDKTFPIRHKNNIANAMKKLYAVRKKPEWIQVRQPARGPDTLCLHRDGRQWFLDNVDVKNIPLKAAEWQSACDLARAKTFPMAYRMEILAALKKLYAANEKPEWIQMRQPARGPDTLCLHRDGRQWFLDRLGKQYVPPKTAEWQSPNDLVHDKTFPMGYRYNISTVLTELYNKNENSEWIQVRQPARGKCGICLHRDGRQWFLDKVGKQSTPIPPKTPEWQSATDLVRDKTFPVCYKNYIGDALKKLYDANENPERIQMRQPARGQCVICLHRDWQRWFLDKWGKQYILPKTAEWQSPNDLIRDETFPMGYRPNISTVLTELYNKNEKPEWIQKRRPLRGPVGLCLHRDGRQWFLDRLGKQYVLPKTAEWQSAYELAKDDTFPMNHWTTVHVALQKLYDANEQPDWIQVRRPTRGPVSVCLHRDGWQWFLTRVEQEKQKKKALQQYAATVLNNTALKTMVANKTHER